MNDQRQAQTRRQIELGVEGPGLVGRRGEVAVEVEAALADRHHPGVGGQGRQLLERGGAGRGRVVGVDPDGGPDPGGARGQVDGRPAGGQVVAGDDDSGHAGRAGAAEDGLQVAVVARVGQMGVGVHQRHGRRRGRAGAPARVAPAAASTRAPGSLHCK